MEPLQSPDDSVRLPDWNEFTKVIFLNDVLFDWPAIVRLLGTSVDGGEADYDLACGIDYGQSGESTCTFTLSSLLIDFRPV